MGEALEEIKRFLIDIFPNLSDDPYFEISSSATPNYNCIAWACNYSDRWIQPTYLKRPNLDSVVWWPPEVEEGVAPSNLKELFEFHGYVECDSGEFEEGYRKVALYSKDDKNNWTHAARQKSNGKWTSKLGQSNDIQHGTPEAIENNNYGKVYCFMKRKFE